MSLSQSPTATARTLSDALAAVNYALRVLPPVRFASTPDKAAVRNAVRALGWARISIEEVAALHAQSGLARVFLALAEKLLGDDVLPHPSWQEFEDLLVKEEVPPYRSVAPRDLRAALQKATPPFEMFNGRFAGVQIKQVALSVVEADQHRLLVFAQSHQHAEKLAFLLDLRAPDAPTPADQSEHGHGPSAPHPLPQVDDPLLDAHAGQA